MADLKISQLTGATTPLAGTEVLPVVQSGTTKNVSVANLTAGRNVAVNKLTASYSSALADAFTTINSATGGKTWLFGDGTAAAAGTFGFYNATNAVVSILLDPAGDVRFSTGNLIQGTAAKGINFTANTPAAGMTSQLLNWYEEGTWTPSVSAATGWTSGAPGSVTATYTRVGRLVTLQLRFALGGSSGNVTAGDSVTITGVPFAESTVTYGQINGANDIVNNVFFTGAALISSSTLICTVATAAGSTPRTNAIFVKITYQV